MGLCFGKPCAESSAPVRHSSPVPIVVHPKRSPFEVSRRSIPKPGSGTADFQELDRHDVHRHTFRDLLSKKAEQAFDPIPARPTRGLPAAKVFAVEKKVRSSQLDCQDILQSFSSTLRNRLRDYDDDLPIFDNSGKVDEGGRERRKEGRKIEDGDGDENGDGDGRGEDLNGESFSSYRGATTVPPPVCDNSKTMIIGNGTPVLPNIAAYIALSGSSSEIIEETGSESSVSKVRITYDYRHSKKSTNSTATSSSSSSSRQDVVSLEFLDEFCRISGVTSHSSSCSGEPGSNDSKNQAVVPIDATTMFSSSRARQSLASSSSSPSASEEESRDRGREAGRSTDVSFLDFLCSRGQVSAKSVTGSVSSSPGSSKKRPSTGDSSAISESSTKKPRVDGLSSRMELLRLCSSPVRTEAKPSNAAEEEMATSLERAPDDRGSKPRPKRGGDIRSRSSPPSTPGSFRSTPFASVGSSFSVDDFSVKKSFSPCTPQSAAASFASAAAALSPEEMAAIWTAFQDGHLSQPRETES